jgi:hypothetical protein
MKTSEKVRDVAGGARPYVDRALTDEELRENVKNAFSAARDIYNELAGRRGVTGIATRVAGDKEIQDSLRTAIEELRSAANRLQGREEHKNRNGMLLLTGIALGILFNPVTGPETRHWVRSKLFGGGDDHFGYEAGGNSGAGA